MIAVDTSSLVAYLEGSKGSDVDALHAALDRGHVVLPPMVLSEILSDPKLPKALVDYLKHMPLLVISTGFWERVGELRSKLIAKKLKSRLGDAMIAQVCIDHDVALITRDKDFRHYKQMAQLNLYPL